MERAKAALGSKKPSKEGAITMCQQLFPISDWLVNYKWKANFVSDIVAGFTIAVMHIPQGKQSTVKNPALQMLFYQTFAIKK